jgi:hypothetical protein
MTTLLFVRQRASPSPSVLGKLTGSKLVAWWFDPRTGSATRLGEFPNTGTKEFDPPGAPQRGNDWVLVLDDLSKDYSAPGVVLDEQRGANSPG